MPSYEVTPEAGRFLVEIVYRNGIRQIVKICSDRTTAENWIAQQIVETNARCVGEIKS